jgi:hypothetical protein
MRKVSVFIFTALFISIHVNAQTGAAKPPVMDKMKFILGEWEGTGWKMSQRGKLYTKAIEKTKCKVDCSVIMVEGLGLTTDSVTKQDKIVHDAFGVISFDAKTNSYSLRAYTKDGVVDSNIEFVEEKVIRWIMDVPGGKIKFTADFKTPNKWLETGEFSRDGGQTWMKFLETDLTKVKD